MLCSYCDSAGLTPAVKHSNANIDNTHTYQFGMLRFSVLDHFLLSGILFGHAARSAFVAHDTDNTSYHELVILNVSLQTRFLASTQASHCMD